MSARGPARRSIGHNQHLTSLLPTVPNPGPVHSTTQLRDGICLWDDTQPLSALQVLAEVSVRVAPEPWEHSLHWCLKPSSKWCPKFLFKMANAGGAAQQVDGWPSTLGLACHVLSAAQGHPWLHRESLGHIRPCLKINTKNLIF